MGAKLQGKKVIGVKQTAKAIKSGAVSVVYVADDAELKVTKPIIDLCNENNIELIHIDTMRQLGNLCGIDVGAATAALINE